MIIYKRYEEILFKADVNMNELSHSIIDEMRDKFGKCEILKYEITFKQGIIVSSHNFAKFSLSSIDTITVTLR